MTRCHFSLLNLCNSSQVCEWMRHISWYSTFPTSWCDDDFAQIDPLTLIDSSEANFHLDHLHSLCLVGELLCLGYVSLPNLGVLCLDRLWSSFPFLIVLCTSNASCISRGNSRLCKSPSLNAWCRLPLFALMLLVELDSLSAMSCLGPCLCLCGEILMLYVSWEFLILELILVIFVCMFILLASNLETNITGIKTLQKVLNQASYYLL